MDFAASQPCYGPMVGSFYSHRGDRDRITTNPLLYVPSHTARDLAVDLEAAGIPKSWRDIRHRNSR
jgi:hypothetical protein